MTIFICSVLYNDADADDDDDDPTYAHTRTHTHSRLNEFIQFNACQLSFQQITPSCV